MNLLKETKDVLIRNGYNPTDIISIGSSDGKCETSRDDFEILLDRECSNEETLDDSEYSEEAYNEGYSAKTYDNPYEEGSYEYLLYIKGYNDYL